MICKEVMRKLEERWNPSYALEWDNVGRFYRSQTDYDDPGGSVLLCNAYEL